MALSKDLIWWGNPERRERVIRLHEEIVSLMRDNFHAVNRLVACLKEQFTNDDLAGAIIHALPDDIKVDNEKTIGQNAEYLLTQITRLDQVYQQIDARMRETLQPNAYNALHDPGWRVKDAISHLSTNVSRLNYVGLSARGLMAIYQCSNPEIFTCLSEFLGFVKASFLASVPIVIQFVAIDTVFGLIFGYLEKCRLEEMISELESVKSRFEPAVRDYTEKIYVAIAMTRIM